MVHDIQVIGGIEMVPREDQIIHCMIDGTVLCRFNMDKPNLWPRRHAYMPKDQFETVTGLGKKCKDCIALTNTFNQIESG